MLLDCRTELNGAGKARGSQATSFRCLDANQEVLRKDDVEAKGAEPLRIVAGQKCKKLTE